MTTMVIIFVFPDKPTHNCPLPAQHLPTTRNITTHKSTTELPLLLHIHKPRKWLQNGMILFIADDLAQLSTRPRDPARWPLPCPLARDQTTPSFLP